MRVGIDATCWSNRRGYGRFTRSLIGALVDTSKDHEYVLFVDVQTSRQGNLPVSAEQVVVATVEAPTDGASARGHRSVRDLLAMSRAVSRHDLDAFFFPSLYTYFPIVSRARIILGIHDVIAEDYPTLIFPDHRLRRNWTIKSWLARQQADYILTVSEHAKRGIVRHFGTEPRRVWVVDEAPDSVFQPIDPENLNRNLLRGFDIASDDRFFLYLGGINPHKNLSLLVDALAEVRRQPANGDVRLLIVGDIHTDVFTPGLAELQRHIDIGGLQDAIHFTGYLPDDEVVHLMNRAVALVLPSFAEGFGLPAVEAAACGIPVIATRNSPLPELLAGGGIFVNPASRDELMRALAHILNDADGRHQMGQKALAAARELTWQRSVAQTEALFAAVERAG